LSEINPFRYAAGPPDFKLKLIKRNKNWRRYLVDFPVVSANHFPNSDIAHGEYFEPIGKEKAPLVIMIHGWGDHSVLPFKWMVAGLVKRGFACFILYLPFHTNGLPPEMKSRLSHLTPEEWFTGYQMAVTDVMRIIDWSEQNSRINKAQISVIALSLGAIVGSIAMGLDKRIKAGVFMVHGGNTGKIMQTNSVSRFGKQFRQSPDIYSGNQKKYLDYLDEIALKGFDNVPPVQNTYLIDPLTYAPMLKGRPVLMINARWDEIFPLESSTDFQRACGGCKRLVLPSSHASIWIWYPIIVHRINKFLELAYHS
jgi:cephalosporin-C deacetylase-like acetyl esterase